MRRQRFQNKVATGRFILPAALLISAICWTVIVTLLPGTGTEDPNWPLWFKEAGNRLPQGIFPSLLGFALYVLTTFFLINLNNIFAIIRIRTSIQSFLFLLLATAFPQLYDELPGLLVGLSFLTAFYQLFGSYRLERSSGALFNTFAFAGIASLFVPQSLLLVPLLWIGAASFQSLNLKSLLASIIGFILPWWVLLSCTVLTGSTHTFFHQLFDETRLFRPVGYGFESWMVFPFGFLFLLFAASAFHYFFNGYEDKIRTRTYLYFLILFGACLFVGIGLQPYLLTAFCPLLLIIVSMLAGHLFALTSNKLSNAFFVISLIGISVMFVYHVWMLL